MRCISTLQVDGAGIVSARPSLTDKEAKPSDEVRYDFRRIWTSDWSIQRIVYALCGVEAPKGLKGILSFFPPILSELSLTTTFWSPKETLR